MAKIKRDNWAQVTRTFYIYAVASLNKEITLKNKRTQVQYSGRDKIKKNDLHNMH